MYAESLRRDRSTTCHYGSEGAVDIPSGDSLLDVECLLLVSAKASQDVHLRPTHSPSIAPGCHCCLSAAPYQLPIDLYFQVGSH